MRAHRRMPARTATLAVAAVLFAFPACAGEVIYDDFGTPYLQRSDTIFPGAGDAKAANSAIHVIDPWPRRAGNRHIPADGERMSGAVERYRDVSKLPPDQRGKGEAPQPIAPVAIETKGFSSGASK